MRWLSGSVDYELWAFGFKQIADRVAFANIDGEVSISGVAVDEGLHRCGRAPSRSEQLKACVIIQSDDGPAVSAQQFNGSGSD